MNQSDAGQPASPQSHSEIPLTRQQRLDRLPVTREHRKIITGSGIGWALDAMDVGLISFVVAQLAQSWELNSTQVSWIVSIGFIGMAIGASMGGLLADRFGRRHVFAITLLVFGIATGASALAGSVAILLVFRFFTGLGLGAELPVASTLVSEFAPSRIRGRIIVILEAFWALGWLLAAIIGYFVVPTSENGWRWALLIGAVPAVYAAIVRFGLPESVRFLETRRKFTEAEAVVRTFEQSAGMQALPATTADEGSAATTESGSPETSVRISAGERLRGLFRPDLRRATVGLWLIWFCVNFSYYGAFIWIPSILVANGHSLVSSFGFTLIMTLAQLPGYAVAAWLIEVWGRRITLAVFLVGSATAAVLFGLADQTWMIILFGSLLSFFNLGAWGTLYAVTPETYPTALRGTGAGWAAGVGRIASIIAPLLVPVLLGVGGSGLLFTIFAAVFLIAAASTVLLMDWRGKALAEF